MEMVPFVRSIVVVALVLMLASAALADVVQLQDGDQITGTFSEASAGIVSIEVGGQVIHFAQDKVRAIYFGAAPAVGQATPSASAPAPSASAPAPNGSAPAPNATAPTPSTNPAFAEALGALKSVQSVIAASADYDKYSARVLEAKPKVDRFLQSEPAESPARAAVARSMQFYTLAATAWNGRLANGTAQQLPEVGRDPLLQQCDEAQQILRKYVQNHDSDKTFGAGYTNGLTIAISGLPALWSCAAREIAAFDKPTAPASAEAAAPAAPRAVENAPLPARAAESARTAECPPGFALNDSKKMCIRQQ